MQADISSSDKLKRASLGSRSKIENQHFHGESCHHDPDFESPALKRLRSSTGTKTCVFGA